MKPTPSKPDVATAAYGYLVTWREGVTILVERIEDHRAELTAELTIRTTRTPRMGRLKWGRMNLMAEVTRKQWANGLDEREPDLDWPGMLDQLAFEVAHKAREGEPAVLMRDIERPEDDGHLLAPLVLGRLPTAFFGDGASAKSLLALAVAASVQSMVPFLGVLPTTQRNVAYLDFEMDGWEHRKRLAGICEAEGVSSLPDVLHVPCRGALWDQLPRLQGIFSEHQIGYAIIDSVSYACGGVPLVSDEAANRFQQASRQLKVGTLAVAHQTKAEDGDRYIFGSIMWQNQFRSVWHVRKSQVEGEPVADIGFVHRKANTGGLEAPLGFTVNFEASRIHFERRDGLAVATEGASVSKQMLVLLRGGPMTVIRIATELGATDAAVRAAFNRGRDRLFSEAMYQGERRISLRPRDVTDLEGSETNVSG